MLSSHITALFATLLLVIVLIASTTSAPAVSILACLVGAGIGVLLGGVGQDD